MKCPFCQHPDSRVLDSRPTEEGTVIRRRRECAGCGRRFTTYEKAEQAPLMVVKRDGRREPFDRSKVLSGLVRACGKRPVSLSTLETLAADVEREVKGAYEPEVSSRQIGELVMNRLRALDEVAYVRFASVYRQFTDINRFMEELERLLRDRVGEKK